MKWIVVFCVLSASAACADDPLDHYEETRTYLEDSLVELKSYYVPIMQGLRFRYELSSREKKVKRFRQNFLPNFKDEIFKICSDLDQRHAAIAGEVFNNPETKISGPTAEQETELESIHRARALCSTRGAYPEAKREKKYWLAYSALEADSFEEYQSIITRLSECLNRQSCRIGAARN